MPLDTQIWLENPDCSSPQSHNGSVVTSLEGGGIRIRGINHLGIFVKKKKKDPKKYNQLLSYLKYRSVAETLGSFYFCRKKKDERNRKTEKR